MRKKYISSAIVRRMPRYYRYFESLNKKGVERISSQMLAMRMGVTASQVRHDFSRFGEFGQQGYGYPVADLKREIAHILGMYNNYRAVVIGAGKLAEALVANFPFSKYGITLNALYDIDPRLVGTEMFGLPVYHIDKLSEHCKESPVDIGVLTASEEAAHELTRYLIECEIKGIWNFTNVELRTKNSGVVVENVELFDSLFYMEGMMNMWQKVSEQGEE